MRSGSARVTRCSRRSSARSSASFPRASGSAMRLRCSFGSLARWYSSAVSVSALPRAVRIVDVLPVGGAHGAHVGRVRERLLEVVLVVPGRPPSLRPSREQRPSRAALHGRGDLRDACQVEDRGRQIDVEHHLVHDLRIADRLRIANEHRDADALLPRRALVDRGVLAQQEAVVAGEDDDRVVELSLRAKRLDDLAERVVDRGDRRVIRPDEGAVVVRLVEWAVDAVPGLHSTTHPVGRARRQHRLGGGLHHAHVVEEMLVLRLDEPAPVRRLVPDLQ